ncbi:hypothetical protein [Halochromatium roseum]|uniref:hypothetical protein n=1 Tax=Halochromatium roseum TaxID=391920 RepID=UPI0019114D5F|nr:hypothetical protein [Halochromatium roseum]MBK5941940.1 hypothetical protein [Halochromatium roseum]
MEAVQFDVELQGDLIPVPARYRAWQGRRVKVILLSKEAPESTTAPRSAIEMLAQTPKHRLFNSADDIDQYIRKD